MKKHKLTSIDGIDPSEFDCIYSPAKRRGPIPRGASSRKFSQSNLSQQSIQELPSQNAQWPSTMQQQMSSGSSSNHLSSNNLFSQVMGHSSNQTQQQQQQQEQPDQNASFNGLNMMSGISNNPDALQQQINMLQQLQQQQQQPPPQSVNEGIGNFDQQQQPDEQLGMNANEQEQQQQQEQQEEEQQGVPRAIANHTHLLESNDIEGSRLHAYYKLSIDELFRLPPTPTDEDLCNNLSQQGVSDQMIPGSQLAALSASRFAEIALGALVHGEVSLGMEISNAVVHCLRESVQDPVQPATMVTVAKTYFLLALFRAYRGDMIRYFKYRRVAMTYLSKAEDTPGATAILAAISFQDSWAYMVHNGNERLLPCVDDTIPPLEPAAHQPFATQTELKFDVRTDIASIVSNPQNKNWIQGAPPVYLNTEAPLNARSLDALACSIRTCCDQANQRFATIAKESGNSSIDDMIPLDTCDTLTTAAVNAHEEELCSRNMVLSAYSLMQRDENASRIKRVNESQQLIISAMDAFLENSDEDGNGGFSDSQIQSLLSVCNITIENPYLLQHAGPTYHIVTNAVILLCHLLNSMYSIKGTQSFGAMEATMFEEVWDTFTSARKLLTIHRRRLPVNLRCHGIPRPALEPPADDEPFIDLGNTKLCLCRGCQGFVLMACSPLVAVERARDARSQMAEETAQEQEALELGEIDRELDIMGEEFNVDDDALLNMISTMITN